MSYLNRLKKAIWASYSCKAVHTKTTSVVDVFRGKVAWEGDVEEFVFLGSRRGEICYAWGYFDDAGDWQVIMVLRNPPIRTPEDAVKAAIAGQARSVQS